MGEEESGGEATGEISPAVQPADVPAETTEAVASPQPQSEGRRTQLRIVREHLENLSSDVGSAKRSSEASAKKLENKIESIRKDLAEYKRSKDISEHAKSSDTSAKRLEKKVSSLSNDVAALKASIAKDAARTRTRQEALMAKILAKVSPKKPAAKKKSTKKK